MVTVRDLQVEIIKAQANAAAIGWQIQQYQNRAKDLGILAEVDKKAGFSADFIRVLEGGYNR